MKNILQTVAGAACLILAFVIAHLVAALVTLALGLVTLHAWEGAGEYTAVWAVIELIGSAAAVWFLFWLAGLGDRRMKRLISASRGSEGLRHG